MSFTEAVLPALLAELEQEAIDCIVHDAIAPWGRHTARLLGTPGINSVPFFPVHPEITSSIGMRVATGMDALRGMGDFVRFRRAARRLQRQHGTSRDRLKDTLLGSASLNLVYTSREFAYLGERFDESYRFLGPPPLETENAAELGGKRNLILISLGTVYNQRQAFYKGCVEAFAEEQIPVVMLLGKETRIDTVGPVPAHFRVENFLPEQSDFLALLRRAALLVTHSGLNSVHQALWYGVPMLSWPQMAEHTFTAWRVQNLGAGEMLKNLRPAQIRLQARRILSDDRYARAAAEVGTTLQNAGGPAKAVSDIFAFLNAHKNHGTAAPAPLPALR
jgi:MGT family glycosyltransferase